MRTDLFDFDLPAERIALRPASPRDSAKMLVVEHGALRDQIISEARIPSSMTRIPFACTGMPASARADVNDRHAGVYRLADSLHRLPLS